MSQPLKLTPGDLASLSLLRRRIHLLKRIVPIVLVLLVVIYEIGPARWILNGSGEDAHLIAEILVYGLFGPILAYLLLHFLDRWLEERETSELQARLLAEAQLRVRIGHELSDDALQTLFAASMLFASLRAVSTELPTDTVETLTRTEESLDRAIQQLRAHLLDQSAEAIDHGND
jgi:hypothetical protein